MQSDEIEQLERWTQFRSEVMKSIASLESTVMWELHILKAKAREIYSCSKSDVIKWDFP